MRKGLLLIFTRRIEPSDSLRSDNTQSDLAAIVSIDCCGSTARLLRLSWKSECLVLALPTGTCRVPSET